MPVYTASRAEPMELHGAPDMWIGMHDEKAKCIQAMKVSIPKAVVDELLGAIRGRKPANIQFGRDPALRLNGHSYLLTLKKAAIREEVYDCSGGQQDFSGLVTQLGSIQCPDNKLSQPNAPAPGSLLALQQAIRYPLAHLLAIRPVTIADCVKKLNASTSLVKTMLNRIGKADGTGKFKLIDKFYKDLDMWKFSYSKEERGLAIENSISAFDRLRLEPDDQTWQKLLPKEERGKGKVLSRLTFIEPPTVAAKKATPSMNPRKILGKKQAAPKRTDEKKAEKESTGRATKVLAVPSTASKPTATSSHHTAAKQVSKPPTSKDDLPRASAATKAMLNKPKNPSPLSTSPPVNASDFDEDHPVHKRLSGSPSPKQRAQKRPDKRMGKNLKKRKSVDERDAPPVKKLHREPAKTVKANGVKSSKPTTSNPSTPANSLKRKAEATTTSSAIKAGQTQPPPAKQRKLVNGEKAATEVHRQPSNPSSTSDSTDSQPLALSWRQSVDLATKFRRYYERYAKLYKELYNAPEPPSEKQREELMRMHRTLEGMKAGIRSGALR